MNQKLILLVVMILGMLSCSTAKKAPYVAPVISVNDSKIEDCENNFSEIAVVEEIAVFDTAQI